MRCLSDMSALRCGGKSGERIELAEPALGHESAALRGVPPPLRGQSLGVEHVAQQCAVLAHGVGELRDQELRVSLRDGQLQLERSRAGAGSRAVGIQTIGIRMERVLELLEVVELEALSLVLGVQ